MSSLRMGVSSTSTQKDTSLSEPMCPRPRRISEPDRSEGPSSVGSYGHPHRHGGLLAGLKGELVELDHLQRDLTRHVEALPLSGAISQRPGCPNVAQELGISVSIVRRLLRQGRLEHLKIGARTLITPAQLFRGSSRLDTRLTGCAWQISRAASS